MSTAIAQNATHLSEQTRDLVEWLLKQAVFYHDIAPTLVGDIQKLQECAAALDAFARGVAIVPPHPATGITHVDWVEIGLDGAPLPANYEWVLLALPTSRHAMIGYRCGDAWITSASLPPVHPLRWAHMPDVPRPYQLAEEVAS